jgi:pantoate--beta-alanine ligase
VTSQMRVLNSTSEMSRACREANGPLGLVPTMGALHAGHLSLVDRARADNATVAVSIFINPSQFGPGEDLSKYPRDLDADLDLLRHHGVDLVYAPDVSEVYSEGFETWVDVGLAADKLEGLERPGHFRGVVTVVSKLFNITRPERAYFGQKDGQQTVVVRKLSRDLDMGVEIVVCPTVREDDGLAMSSRNARLDPEQRRAAATVFWALSQARELWGGGDVDADRLRAAVRDSLETHPLLQRIDYVSVADGETLEELETVVGPAMISTAVRLGNVRIIDNVFVG